ncbi:hypothetical protein IAQ61_009919 [Plenodomus lingam]|uniref:uncharacterized protein n=1 Tax=Leptosphaeria maculans TaxID=5022 RepID=UPI0033183551|nr:hypothetical protein IAQ61_009919 [Plenodomus lingam]
MAEEAQKNNVQLAAEQLAEGFAVLSGEYQILFDQQRQLESKLSWAKQQYLDLLKRFTPATLSQDHIAFLQDLERVGGELPRAHINLVEQLAHSDDVERKSRAVAIQKAEEAALTLRRSNGEPGVTIWSGPSADNSTTPSETRAETVKSPLERDFTVAGTPSKLGCPFASTTGRRSPLATPRSSTSRLSQRGRRSHRASFNDPIRAELCGNDATSVAASVAVSGSAAVCPIRFLDQHDPEEVAKYFEKHKHELPRSHEVCITRFQRNAESIEQLDRKYGNLVNMIQGLGQKHQAWLPEEPEDVIAEEPGIASAASADAKADAKVQRWATAVSASLHGGTPPPEDSEPEVPDPDEARTAHFDRDRPLKEVRVGESPSRPWGISIPAKYTNADSSSSVGSVPTASPQLPTEQGESTGQTPQKTRKCPFDHGAMMGQATTQPEATPVAPPTQPSEPIPLPTPPPPEAQPPLQAPESATKAAGTPNVIPQMVFNGPVFLGYPPEQLIALLQNSNLGAAMR